MSYIDDLGGRVLLHDLFIFGVGSICTNLLEIPGGGRITFTRYFIFLLCLALLSKCISTSIYLSWSNQFIIHTYTYIKNEKQLEIPNITPYLFYLTTLLTLFTLLTISILLSFKSLFLSSLLFSFLFFSFLFFPFLFFSFLFFSSLLFSFLLFSFLLFSSLLSYSLLSSSLFFNVQSTSNLLYYYDYYLYNNQTERTDYLP